MEDGHNNDFPANLRREGRKSTLPPHPAVIFELAGLENRFTSGGNSPIKPDSADRLLAVLAPKWWEHLNDTEVLRRVMCEVKNAGKSKKTGVRRNRKLQRSRIVYNLTKIPDKYRPGYYTYGGRLEKTQ